MQRTRGTGLQDGSYLKDWSSTGLGGGQPEWFFYNVEGQLEIFVTYPANYPAGSPSGRVGRHFSEKNMSIAEEIVAEINSGVPTLKSGSISLFGEVFGGRIDNLHIVTGASLGADKNSIVVHFNQGETLEVWSPSEAVASSSQVHFGKASRVRWEWTYYGRPATPENRLFLDYRVRSGEVIASTNAPWVRQTERTIESIAEPAAEIVWFQ